MFWAANLSHAPRHIPQSRQQCSDSSHAAGQVNAFSGNERSEICLTPEWESRILGKRPTVDKSLPTDSNDPRIDLSPPQLAIIPSFADKD